MKKIVKMIALVTVTICLMTCTLLFGCGNNATAEATSETTPVNLSAIQPTETIETEYVFTEVPKMESPEDAIQAYRDEFKKRCESNTLEREDEIEFLRENGFFISTGSGGFTLDEYWELASDLWSYEDPIVFQSENGVEVWAINKWGELYIQSVIGLTSTERRDDYCGLIHRTTQEAEANGEVIIQSNIFRVITYQAETGTVKHWEYGEQLGEFKVPANSVYVGPSNWVGYLFRDGTDVWAVRGIHNDDERYQDSEIIAHNVQFVVTAGYYADSDEYLPLFHMTDGSLKLYVYYEGKYEDPVDSESKLVDIEYEGDYDTVEIVDHYTNRLEVEAWLNANNEE